MVKSRKRTKRRNIWGAVAVISGALLLMNIKSPPVAGGGGGGGFFGGGGYLNTPVAPVEGGSYPTYITNVSLPAFEGFPTAQEVINGTKKADAFGGMIGGGGLYTPSEYVVYDKYGQGISTAFPEKYNNQTKKEKSAYEKLAEKGFVTPPIQDIVGLR